MLIMKVNDDLSESIYYISDTLRAYIAKSALSSYPDYSAFNHWHDDIEFMVILSGKMKYNINGEIITLHSGEGLFVNAKQMHYGFSDNYHECIFICVVLHPMMLGASPYIEEKFIKPVISDTSVPYFIFHESIPWEKEVLNQICEIYYYRDQEIAELKTQSLFNDIWCKLYQNMLKAQPIHSPAHHLQNLKDMITYIHDNYSQKFSLQDIASAGLVGKTTCYNLFKTYTHKTPLEYLIHYRIQRSLLLLKDKKLSITQISFEVGFSSASYFTETFKKIMKMTPNQYRKNYT